MFACVLPEIEREREKKRKIKKAIHQEEMWGGKEGRRIKMHPLKLAEKEAVISDVFYRELCGDGHGQYILRGFT